MRSTLRSAITCLALLALASPAFTQVWALHGTVITPAGPVSDATVLIDGNQIRAVGHGIDLPPNTRLIETNGFIFPGLIDLHNHVTWNVFSHWSAGSKFGARYDWQQLPEYQMALDTPHQHLIAEGHGCAAERYAEIKALLGGATSQAGLDRSDLTTPSHLTAGFTPAPGCLGGQIRELGVSSRLYSASTPEPLRYEIFPLALDAAHTSALAEGLNNHTIQATLAHIAEGAATDASARREFGFLQSRGLLTPGLSIIHGVALTPANFADMAKANVGLVWSPQSNFELYGSTADVASAKRAGVTIALAPDWSPTGSDGMLQELKYAAIWNATQSPAPFTDRELVDMATQNAATLAGSITQTGTIAVGKRADLLVLQSPGSDPYNALVHASPANVALIVVDGVPTYGDPTLMKRAPGEHPNVALSVCGTSRQLALPDPASWAATVAELTAGLNRWGATLSPLTDCR